VKPNWQTRFLLGSLRLLSVLFVGSAMLLCLLAPTAHAQPWPEFSERNFSITRLQRQTITGTSADGVNVRLELGLLRMTARRNVRFNDERLREGDQLFGWARYADGGAHWLVPPSREVFLLSSRNLGFARQTADAETLIKVDLLTGEVSDSGLAGLQFVPSSYPLAQYEERNGQWVQQYSFAPSRGVYVGMLPGAPANERVILGPLGEPLTRLTHIDDAAPRRIIRHAEHEALLLENPLLQHDMQLFDPNPDPEHVTLPMHLRPPRFLSLFDYPIMATPGGALVVRHRQDDGQILWGIYGTDGALTMPLLEDLHFTFRPEQAERNDNLHIPHFVFMIPLEAEQGLYWPIQDDGTPVPAAEGIVGFRPITGGQSMRNSMRSWSSGFADPWAYTAVLWENDGQQLWALANGAFNDERLTLTRPGATWQDWQVIEFGIDEVQVYVPTTDYYGRPFPSGSLPPMMARAGSMPGVMARMADGPVFVLTPDTNSQQPGAWREVGIGPFASYEDAQRGLQIYNNNVRSAAAARTEELLATYREQRARMAAANEAALRNLNLRSIELRGPGSDTDVEFYCAHRDADACTGMRNEWERIKALPPPPPPPASFGSRESIWSTWREESSNQGYSGPSALGGGYRWSNGSLVGPFGQMVDSL